jgi:hypothetical protein
MSRVIFAMLAITGRITMLGLSRWADKGGSYRTIQRLYHTKLPWEAIHWKFFTSCLHRTGEYIIAGDEVVVSKAGTETYGLDRFFSGLRKQVIPSLAFFAFSVVDVDKEHSFPLSLSQIVKSAEEKSASKAKKEAKENKKTAEAGKVGRPKGSKNKAKAEQVALNPELLRIEKGLKSLLATVGQVLSLQYVVLDGHFGNYPSAYMVTKANLHLISKMRSDVALYQPFAGQYSGIGRPPKYGGKLNIYQLDEKYRKATTQEENIRTDIYQGKFYNKEFDFPLNVVIIVKTNLLTKAQAHVVLFSSDLEQAYEKIIKFYSLRFQIEFNFRDAKQYWGLEDFMNVKETAVTNAANLSIFMVSFSWALLHSHREATPNFSVLDLKAYYRGYRYAIETIKMVLEQPNPILKPEILNQIAQLGAIHPHSVPLACQ